MKAAVIPIFPMVVDNTMREELIRCEKAAYWNHERGLKLIGEDPDLHAGHAFAKGVEMARRAFWEEGQEAYDAVLAGVGALYKDYGNFVYPTSLYKFKTADRMAGALTYYFEKHPFDREIKPLQILERLAIEYGFGSELLITHPTKGIKLVYGTKPDLIEVRNGVVWAVDEKTGGNLSDAWANQWTMNSQITGYCWAIQKLLIASEIDLPFGGVEVRGVGIGKTQFSHVPLQITRMQWEIDRWYKQMVLDIKRWTGIHLYGLHSMALGHACATYNAPCAYQKLCKAHDPEYLIEGNYEVRHWNPLEKQK